MSLTAIATNVNQKIYDEGLETSEWEVRVGIPDKNVNVVRGQLLRMGETYTYESSSEHTLMTAMLAFVEGWVRGRKAYLDER